VPVTPPAVTYLQAEPIYIRTYATGLFISLINLGSRYAHCNVMTFQCWVVWPTVYWLSLALPPWPPYTIFRVAGGSNARYHCVRGIHKHWLLKAPSRCHGDMAVSALISTSSPVTHRIPSTSTISYATATGNNTE
jgi:hypothetical protein